MKKASIGLDIGSSVCKAFLFDGENVIAKRKSPTPYVQDHKHNSYIDADALFQLLINLINALLVDSRDRDLIVENLGLSSLVDSYLLLDKNLKALTPVIPWFNSDGQNILKSISRVIDPYELWHRSGQILSIKKAPVRYIQLKQLFPDAYKRAPIFSSLYAYILYRFTGHLFTDYSVASRSALFSLEDTQFDVDLCRLFQIDKELPDLFPIGEATGQLRKSIIEHLNLDDNAIITGLGHDHLVAYQILKSEYGRIISNSMGTAEVYTGLFELSKRSKSLYEAGVTLGALDNQEFYWLANQPSCGACFKSYVKQYFSEQLDDIANSVDNIYEPEPENSLIEPMIFESLNFYLPYINGSGTPETNSQSRYGFPVEGWPKTAYEASIAIAESLAFENLRIFSAITPLITNIGNEKIIASGGVSRNNYLLNSKSSLLNRDIYRCSVSDLSVLGAAALVLPNRKALNLNLEKFQAQPEEHNRLSNKFLDYLQFLKLYD